MEPYGSIEQGERGWDHGKAFHGTAYRIVVASAIMGGIHGIGVAGMDGALPLWAYAIDLGIGGHPMEGRREPASIDSLLALWQDDLACHCSFG
jgi:hypothetical protein